MKRKVDGRLPREIPPSMNSLKPHSALSSPWGKLVNYRDAAYYAQRYGAVFSAAVLQAYRILVPDYEERAEMMTRDAYRRLGGEGGTYRIKQYYDAAVKDHNFHPFCLGNFVGGLQGDWGDETQCMYGRVNDMGTYRVEKELDYCAWDICGSEVCRATTQSLLACADVFAEGQEAGPTLEYHMVEARGCGDLHCRIVAESREKYPMPEHKFWEVFGPIATADQIKYTPEEEMLSDPEIYREDCDYRYVSGTCEEHTQEMLYPNVGTTTAATYIIPAIERHIERGDFTSEFANHVLRCVCEAAGKAVFGEFYAVKGARDWLGVPEGVNDGRVAGASIEMYLQCAGMSYQIEEFNKDTVIYKIDRYPMAGLMPNMARVPVAYIAFWYGMTKSLVNAQWSLWEEGSDANTIRIKIAKKIDKFC